MGRAGDIAYRRGHYTMHQDNLGVSYRCHSQDDQVGWFTIFDGYFIDQPE